MKKINDFGLNDKVTLLNNNFTPLNHNDKKYIFGLPPSVISIWSL